MTAFPSGISFGLIGFDGLFDLHIAKFFRVKDLATFQALNKFNIVMPGDDTHIRVFAGGGHDFRFV